MAGEPVLGKLPPQPHWEYKLLTWPRFMKLRGWAQRIADHEGAPVYLVGSALTKAKPRDLDLSIIVPHDRFVAQFGSLPLPSTPEMHRLMDTTHRYLYAVQPYWHWQIEMGLYMGFQRVDLRICPDSWWPEKDKLLLAAPHA